VRCTRSSSGRVTSAALNRGSGASVLDQAELSMEQRASPFPPFPSGIGRSSIAFAAPVRFDLR
jgi:protein TonB